MKIYKANDIKIDNMESADKDLERIMYYCEKISSRQQNNSIFKDWLENTIFKFGTTIFQTNLPNIAQYSNKIHEKILIFSGTLTSEMFDKLNGLNYWFVKQNANKNENFIFIKFLHVLTQKYPNFDYIFLSTSPFLIKDEFVLNVYNIQNIQSYMDFINIQEIFENSGIKLLNLDKNGIFANNLSFINPSAPELLKINRTSRIVFDLQYNSNISKDQLKFLIQQINAINLN